MDCGYIKMVANRHVYNLNYILPGGEKHRINWAAGQAMVKVVP